MSSYCLASLYIALEKLVSLMKSCETALFLLLNSSVAFCNSSSDFLRFRPYHCTCVCGHCCCSDLQSSGLFPAVSLQSCTVLCVSGFLPQAHLWYPACWIFYPADCLDVLVVFCWIFSCSASDSQSLGSVEFCYYGLDFSLDAIFSCLGYLFSLSLVSFHIWIGIILCFIF